MEKKSKNLIVFLVATFVWTWICYAPIVISGNSPYLFPWVVLLILGGAGPSIVGVLIVLIKLDKEQRRDYWHRCFSFTRIKPKWWLIIVLIFPLLFGLSIFADVLMGGSLPGMTQLKALISTPIMWPLVAFISFMSGPWSEEFGWRGIALEPIIERFGTLRGSTLLGLIWGLWHLPLFFMPATWHGQIGFKFAGFWTFIIFSVGLSMIMTWVFQNTDSSILSAMFVHFCSNFSSQLLTPSSERFEILRAITVLVVGLTVCLLLKHSYSSIHLISEDRLIKKDTIDWELT